MPKVIVSTNNAPRSAAYSQAVKAGGLVFVSGQGPFHPATGELVGQTIQEQTAQCLRNVQAILRSGQLARPGCQRHVHPRQFGRLPWHERGVGAVVPLGPSGSSRGETAARPRGFRLSIAVIAEAS